jgi:hypothetical protein
MGTRARSTRGTPRVLCRGAGGGGAETGPFVNQALYRSYAMLCRAWRGARWGARTAVMPRFRS